MDIDAYLRRIGVSGRPEPTLDSLAELASAHLRSVPFENLDIAAGRPLSLEPEAIFDKLVVRRRGGFCYELNGLFGWLLRDLGFEVTLLAAQTVDPTSGDPGQERAHLVLLVDLDGRWLVDIGWGEVYRGPFALRAGNEHTDGGIASYRLDRLDGRWQIVERHDDSLETNLKQIPGWRIAYRFDLTPHELPDFVDTCRWQETESPFFTGHRFCTIATPYGRRTLMDDRLIVREGGTRTRRPVTDQEWPGLLEELFGVRDALT
ncbi:MAG TPA: arylamine N-acetyltransferase [Gaiellaceae bacterium]